MGPHGWGTKTTIRTGSDSKTTEVYQGMFIDGKEEGFGTWTYTQTDKSGNIQNEFIRAGEWMEGKNYGKTTRYYKDGKVCNGIWTHGKDFWYSSNTAEEKVFFTRDGKVQNADTLNVRDFCSL